MLWHFGNHTWAKMEIFKFIGDKKIVRPANLPKNVPGRGYRVYVGKVNNTEIDFVAENRDGIKYFQVALTVRDEKVLERELRSLKNTEDHYPKYLITMDMDLTADYEGITKINIIDWLLQ